MPPRFPAVAAPLRAPRVISVGVPLLALLAGCGSVDGTWMFTREVTVATGDECTSGVTHDFVGAYPPADSVDDSAWTETDTAEVSSDVFFGRIDREGKSAVLIVGTSAWPGVKQADGSWVFSWNHTAAGQQNDQHETGYQYIYTYDTTNTTRVSGTFSGDSFIGKWEDTSESTSSWTESDTWSDEVAATVGPVGRVPASSYLLKLDSDGNEVAASNDYATPDCDVSGCLLTVTEACGYTYELTGVATVFSEADAPWTSDAGQGAGL